MSADRVDTEKTLKKIADPRTREMYEQYMGGSTLKEVGERFGVTYQAVSDRFRRAGLSAWARGEARARRRGRLLKEKTADIRAEFSQSKDIDDVARRLRVSRSIVREVVERSFTTAERRRPHASQRRYSDGELISFLKAASDEVPGVLTASAYENRVRARWACDGRRPPSVQTFNVRFGSWREALAAAGLPAYPASPRARRRRFESRDCVEAIHTAARKLGKTPTVREYRAFAAASDGRYPSWSTIANCFGGWYRALIEAGL